MGNNPDILKSLSTLDGYCPAGYAMALHISFTTPKFLFQTYNRDWMEHYSKHGLVLKDPTVKWGFGNTGHVLWSDLKEQDTDGVLEAAKSYGIGFGFTYCTDAHGSRSISSFARNDRDFTGAEISDISALVDLLHSETADLDGISSQERDQLKKISVEFTHG